MIKEECDDNDYRIDMIEKCDDIHVLMENNP